LKALNLKVYAVERVFCAIAIAIMGTVVFFDVLHRFWTRQEGLFSRLYGMSAAGQLGSKLTGAVIMLGFAYLAARTRGRAPGLPTAVRAALAVGLMWVFMEAFVWLLPSGLVWSQTLGLVLMLWVATLGASLATYEHRHLALDLGSKLWPKKALPYAQAFGNLVTTLFCLLLAVLACSSIKGHFIDWQETSGSAGVFAALAVPKWLAFLALPVAFSIMALRFFAHTLQSFRGAVEEDDPLQMLGLKK